MQSLSRSLSSSWASLRRPLRSFVTATAATPTASKSSINNANPTQNHGAAVSTRMLKWRKGLHRPGVLAFKLGMATHFDEWGRRIPVTILHVADCQVIRSWQNHNATILEMGIGHKSPKQLDGARRALFQQLGVAPKLEVHGYSVTKEVTKVLQTGASLYAAHFVPGQYVDCQSKSIGKGFQGAMVRWGFSGMPASHGCSVSHRALGSTGARTTPGRTLKGKKMAGRMGGHQVTCKRLEVIKIDNALNCIMVKGAVAGHEGTVVKVYDSKHNPIFRTTPPPYPTFIPSKDGPQLPRFLIAPPSTKDTLHISEPSS